MKNIDKRQTLFYSLLYALLHLDSSQLYKRSKWEKGNKTKIEQQTAHANHAIFKTIAAKCVSEASLFTFGVFVCVHRETDLNRFPRCNLQSFVFSPLTHTISEPIRIDQRCLFQHSICHRFNWSSSRLNLIMTSSNMWQYWSGLCFMENAKHCVCATE